MPRIFHWCGMVLVFGLSVANAADLARWKFIQELRLDTSVAGVNVPGDVTNFPLAVALGPDNFDFSKARPDGGDIRFSAETNSAPLKDEHWVKLDYESQREGQRLLKFGLVVPRLGKAL